MRTGSRPLGTIPRPASSSRSAGNWTCGTLGALAPDRGNAVLMLYGTVGSSKQFLQPSVADFLFAPDRPLDADKYFIIFPDAIGHGGSSKPSDGLETAFPRYCYADIVEAQHRLVTAGVGLKRLRLVLGTSMGGMQTWMWVVNAIRT
jgi:homoserine O-acetyltransferase/O-succinyltransferase